jgi:hypothetical protein
MFFVDQQFASPQHKGHQLGDNPMNNKSNNLEYFWKR